MKDWDEYYMDKPTDISKMLPDPFDGLGQMRDRRTRRILSAGYWFVAIWIVGVLLWGLYPLWGWAL